jgi:hypothetical protein
MREHHLVLLASKGLVGDPRRSMRSAMTPACVMLNTFATTLTRERF